jgi:hypothetical protein
MAGQVPPFGARVVVAAVVAREHQWAGNEHTLTSLHARCTGQPWQGGQGQQAVAAGQEWHVDRTFWMVVNHG